MDNGAPVNVLQLQWAIDAKTKVLVAGLFALIAYPEPAHAQVEAFFYAMDQMMGEGARQQQVTGEREGRRDAFETRCAGAGDIVEDWQTGRNFTSRWVARLEE